MSGAVDTDTMIDDVALLSEGWAIEAPRLQESDLQSLGKSESTQHMRATVQMIFSRDLEYTKSNETPQKSKTKLRLYR